MFFKKILFSNSNKAMEFLNESDLLNKMIPPFKKIDGRLNLIDFIHFRLDKHFKSSLYFEEPKFFLCFTKL